MFVFQKIWRALFSWNTRFEIRPFALLPTNSRFGLKSFVILKFFCAGCNTSYVGEIYTHVSTRTYDEHFKKDKKSNIY